LSSIFRVENVHLERLGPEDAVEFVRGLLWAEATRIGLPTTQISISSWVDVSDGGIDAAVEDNSAVPPSSFLRKGHVGYQIKAGNFEEGGHDARHRSARASPDGARVVRGTVLAVKQHTFVDAAQALGASPGRIVARHILPNVFAPILVIATVWLGNAIVIEAALSFLGLGTPPPTPTWGAMLSGEGRRNLETAPYLAIFPGVAISIVVLACNMLGDALRDLLDPRLRSR
jgi:Binding-protein-dependent transport system inner membrane component